MMTLIHRPQHRGYRREQCCLEYHCSDIHKRHATPSSATCASAARRCLTSLAISKKMAYIYVVNLKAVQQCPGPVLGTDMRIAINPQLRCTPFVCVGIFCSHASAVVGNKISVKDEKPFPWLRRPIAKFQRIIRSKFTERSFLQTFFKY